MATQHDPTLQRQYVGTAIKLDLPERFEGDMDYEVVESFIWSMDNYFELTSLVDPHQQAHFVSTRFSKSAQLWLRNQNFDFTLLVWPDLKAELRRYFRPADFHHRARDSLATCKQTKGISAYIDAMKCCS